MHLRNALRAWWNRDPEEVRFSQQVGAFSLHDALTPSSSSVDQRLAPAHRWIEAYLVKKSNKTDFGKLQIKRGNAEVYVFDHTPFKRIRLYRAAQSSATSSNRGLWGAH